MREVKRVRGKGKRRREWGSRGVCGAAHTASQVCLFLLLVLKLYHRIIIPERLISPRSTVQCIAVLCGIYIKKHSARRIIYLLLYEEVKKEKSTLSLWFCLFNNNSYWMLVQETMSTFPLERPAVTLDYFYAS